MSINVYSKLLNHKLLTKGETYDLILEFQNTDDPFIKRTVEEKLIKYNFKYIYQLAAKFYNCHSEIDLDDYIQVASLSLRKALEKFDCSRNLSFSTYFTWWCRAYLYRHYQKQSRTVTIPCHVQETFRKIQKTRAKYEKEHNSECPLSHIANQLNISEEVVTNILLNMRSATSLDLVVVGEEGSGGSGGHQTPLIDLLCDIDSQTPEKYLDSLAQSEYLDSLLNQVTTVERELLLKRFGLLDGKPSTLDQIAKIHNVTRESVRGKIVKALVKLRKSSLTIK
jgi:RNA polymerase sigma factor (sigma-70 family)